MNWQLLLYVLGAALLAWLAFRMVKNNPQAFSKGNLSKSIGTLGVLALILIGVIGLAVLLLR